MHEQLSFFQEALNRAALPIVVLSVLQKTQPWNLPYCRYVSCAEKAAAGSLYRTGKVDGHRWPVSPVLPDYAAW